MSEIFAARLQSARQLRKMSQSELAEKAGLQPSAISHFENDRRSPSFDNLKTLANALNVPTDYLLGRIDSPTLTGATRDVLFRHAQNMSKNDLETLTSFAAMLAQKAEQTKKD
jgi:transcriptional regulator with XRE-family HTH domain